MNNRLDLITNHEYVVRLAELFDAFEVPMRRYDDPRLQNHKGRGF